MSKKRTDRALTAPRVRNAPRGPSAANITETSTMAVGVVPKPVKLELGADSFQLSPKCQIAFEKNSVGARTAAEYLADTLLKATGLSFPVCEAEAGCRDSILLTAVGADDSLGPEGYRLQVTPRQVVIRAQHAAGLFYGVQTLRQLLPPEGFGSGRLSARNPWIITCLRIEDYPRFQWRGMHLDVSRHFFDVEFVKRYLDHLALHKINVFHWHLTDDDGWRVEIKQYPKLTRVGAWRGANEALPASYGSGDRRYGGFYTQDQVREIIRFAAARHILIVPEVDVPAHSRAAVVAYPELLCAGDPYQFKSGQGVAANVLCPSQAKTYTFLEGVLGELADLFPGPYLHVGGDERPKGPWEQCGRCLKRMREEALPDGTYLQDRFLKRIQEFLRTRGKRMMGWDELKQESVLEKDYTVMAWNSVNAGTAAARKGYPVVMAPTPFTYFDLACSEDAAEPGERWAGTISLEKAYSFDPAPANLSRKVRRQILGVHGCLWSETLVTPDRPDYMAYPRLCALAEIGWTPQHQRGWREFWGRLWRHHLARLDAAGIAYRIPPPSVRQKGREIVIVPPHANAEVRYTVDGSRPGRRSTLYQRPFRLPKNGVLRMRTFRPNGRGSRTVTGAATCS